MKGFIFSIIIGAVTGVVIFLTADYISTKSTDRFKKTLFEAGYLSAMGDVKEAIEKKDSIIDFQTKIDRHWDKVKVLYKNGN